MIQFNKFKYIRIQEIELNSINQECTNFKVELNFFPKFSF